MGPIMRYVLVEFCSRQEVVTQQNGYYGTQFRVTRGTTQGGSGIANLFNMSVYIVVL